MMKWAEHVARTWKREVHKKFIEESEGKKSLAWPRSKWGNIEMDLKEIGYENVDWINLF
jgi:hypothetical protein